MGRSLEHTLKTRLGNIVREPVSKKRKKTWGNVEINMHTWEMTSEDEGKRQGNTPIVQRILNIARKSPEARGEARNRFFLTALRSNKACEHLDLELQSFVTARQ